MRSNRTIPRLFLSGVVLFALAACDGSEAGKDPAGNAAGAGPADVAVVTLAPERVPLIVELPGRTVASRMAEVRPQVGGILQKRLFEEGAEVKAGQQLYQIDPESYQAALSSALAELARVRANVAPLEAKAARYRDLAGIDAVSKQDDDDARAALAQARAQVQVALAAVETARINLKYTRVYAPIGGRISKSSMTEGALVTAGQAQALATITQLDPIYVDVSQPSQDVAPLRQGPAGQGPVTLLLNGTGKVYDQTGRLQFSEVTVDPSTGTVQLRALFPNPRQDLYPGLFVRARIEQGLRDGALLVPQKAVTRSSDGSAAVWLAGPGDKAQRRAITVARVVGERWLVEEGLSAGERVVVEGGQKLHPDQDLRPVPAAPPQPASPAVPPAR
ncbi:MAG: efflux RND transporter periplasmic adaptor subunit [Telmatospirillum sp.]|nr:efflux RND transporter periplasmic adaptor subunit [Telmatospirillum sp.]